MKRRGRAVSSVVLGAKAEEKGAKLSSQGLDGGRHLLCRDAVYLFVSIAAEKACLLTCPIESGLCVYPCMSSRSVGGLFDYEL
jgi:hypothetical protein